MANPIILPELRLMLAEGDEQGLRDVVMELHPATVADFTEGLTVDETWKVLAASPLARQAEVFAYYPIAEAGGNGAGFGPRTDEPRCWKKWRPTTASICCSISIRKWSKNCCRWWPRLRGTISACCFRIRSTAPAR